MPKLEDLSINELKSKLVSAAKETAEAMAPMLFYLRKKIKAQGKVGQGFGAWVEENLGITRRTADRWANEWAIANKLKDQPKPASRQKSKGDGLGAIADGERKEYFSLNLSLTPSEQEQVIMAWEVLGEEAATRLICDTLTAAAKAKEPKTDTFKIELGELQEVGVVSPKRPARSERVTYAEDGEAG